MLLCVIFCNIVLIFKNGLLLKITTFIIFPSDLNEIHFRIKLTSLT